jgi:hypothetical protein
LRRDNRKEVYLAVGREGPGKGVAQGLVADEEVVQLVIREHAFREVSDVENGGAFGAG